MCFPLIITYHGAGYLIDPQLMNKIENECIQLRHSNKNKQVEYLEKFQNEEI